NARSMIAPYIGSGRLRLIYRLDAIQKLAEVAFRDLNVEIVLQIEPKLCRRAERLGESKGSIGAYARLFARDPLNSRARQAANFRKRARRHLERKQEFLAQH